MPEQSERHFDEIVARPGLVEHGAEQDEQEHETGGDSERNAKHSLGGQPLVRHHLAQTLPLVRDHVRHIGPAEGVGEEHDRDDHQRWPERTTRGLEQHQHADYRGHQVEGRRRAGATGQLTVEDGDVGRAERAECGKHPVLDRDMVTR